MILEPHAGANLRAVVWAPTPQARELAAHPVHHWHIAYEYKCALLYSTIGGLHPLLQLQSWMHQVNQGW